MTGVRNEAAWTAFWDSGGDESQSGCLPKGLERIDRAQRLIWQEAARPLPRGSRVVDLATGNGAVLSKILGLRSDLSLTGIDSSATLPRGPKGATLRAGVPMEDLPFADGSIDLVTSQFGFEYGDTGAIGREVARILKQQGAFHFLIHHAQGPIVAHNETRRDGLVWAVSESGLLDKARAFVRARATIDLPTPASFRDAPAEARRQFPDQTAGAEFAMAVLQTLELGRQAPLSESLEVLDTLESKARSEIARIDALQVAARNAGQIARLVAELSINGLKAEEPKPVCEADSSIPFAWHLQGRLR